ncbi:MAG: hypothetical protein ABIV06_06925, partial [Thermoanaerobaculia bacterium]
MKNRPDPETDVSEEALILHHYGESPDPHAVDRALAADADLRRRYVELVRDLATATVESPEPPADLAARVWQEIRPRLEQRLSWRERLAKAVFGSSTRRADESAGWGPPWSLAAASLVVVAALGFGHLAGRRELPLAAVASNDVALATGLSTAARERLLLASVENHLAGSERLLTRV